MTTKERCQEVMGKFFGPATAQLVARSTDTDEIILAKCKEKISTFFGTDKSNLFERYAKNEDQEAKKILFA